MTANRLPMQKINGLTVKSPLPSKLGATQVLTVTKTAAAKNSTAVSRHHTTHLSFQWVRTGCVLFKGSAMINNVWMVSWEDKAFKEWQITGLMWNLSFRKKKERKRKKIEIHVFDSALKALWENDLNGSDRRLYWNSLRKTVWTRKRVWPRDIWSETAYTGGENIM